MILHHALGKALDLWVGRFFGDLAELDLGHAALGGLGDEVFVLLAQGFLGSRLRNAAAGSIGLAGLGQSCRGREQPDSDEGGGRGQETHHGGYSEIQNLAFNEGVRARFRLHRTWPNSRHPRLRFSRPACVRQTRWACLNPTCILSGKRAALA